MGNRSTKESSECVKWSDKTQSGIEWNIYSGDALETLRLIPPNSFSCVVTSPPYYWLRDYGVENQIGQEKTVGNYVDAIADVMDEVYRVLCPDGLLFLNLGDTYYSGKGKSHGTDRKSSKRRFGLRAVDVSGGLGIGLQQKTAIGIPWRVALEMITRQWILRSPIIWNREHALPESVSDRPKRGYEFVFMLAKSRHYYFNHKPLEEVSEEDIWTIAARPKTTNGINTAPFPDELVIRCLEIGCPPEGHVLDPFMGSGTTIRVAVQTGRPATGIDLNPEFCEFAVSQLRKI